MSPSRVWDGSPIVPPFLSQSEAKSKNQEAKRALIPQKHRIYKREVTRGRGDVWDAVPAPVRNLRFLNLPLHGLLRNP